MLARCTGDGDNEARSPGRARRKPLKPFAQGVPDRSANLWWTYSCAFSFRTRGCGGVRASGIPCALSIQGERYGETSGVKRRGSAEVWNWGVFAGELVMPGLAAFAEASAAQGNPGPGRAWGGRGPGGPQKKKILE